MREWIAIRQTLTALDVVMRRWGRETGLRQAEVIIVLLLATREERSASELALLSGRARQLTHRSLGGLRRKGLARIASTTREGKAERWALTDRGWASFERLSLAGQEWRRIVGPRVDLDELAHSLRRVVEILVNRPSARGWGRGLLIPPLLRDEWHARARGEVDAKDAAAPLLANEPPDSEAMDPKVEVEAGPGGDEGLPAHHH